MGFSLVVVPGGHSLVVVLGPLIVVGSCVGVLKAPGYKITFASRPRDNATTQDLG